GTAVREVEGHKVGFIGMTLEGTPTLVSPSGVSSVELKDEVESANANAAALQAQGVESSVVLLHEGGYQSAGINGCAGGSGPVRDIHEGPDPPLAVATSAATHEAYACQRAAPAGEPRMLTSAASYGELITDTGLVISRTTGDVARDAASSVHLVVSHGA